MRELKLLLQNLCLHKYMNVTSKSADSEVQSIELALGCQLLDDNKSLNEHHIEFGERIMVVLPQP